VLKCPGLAPHFLIEVTRPDRLDEVCIKVETRQGCAESDYPAQARLLGAYIKEVVGITARIETQPAGTIPRSAGKAVRVRDLRRA
jgi:phenylacetate-CoA ligase